MASCSSSSSVFSGELITLDELQWGVVKTFKPRDAQLVGHYLYNQIMPCHSGNGKQPFPELDIYGETGMVPWVIWDSFDPIRLPHQDFLYFFVRLKKLSAKGKGKRLSRRVGSGGTWSETETSKPVFIDGFQEPVGRMRKFRYENTKEEEFEHQSKAWMMEEFSIDPSFVPSSSDLVLCRMKRNNNTNKRKRKSEEDEEANARRTKCFKPQEQLPSHSHHEQPQLSDINPQELYCVQELVCEDNVDKQVDQEQGSSGAQHQQIVAPHFDNSYNCIADPVIVTQNESEDAQLEDDTGWLDDVLEEEDPSNSLSENQISAGDDLISTVTESTNRHLEEEESTDQSGYASEGAGGGTLPPALLEQHTSASPLMFSQDDDDQTFAFAVDNHFIPMEGASYFESDDNSNFVFHLENQ